MSNWTKCSIDLPKDTEVVLIFTRFKTKVTARYSADTNSHFRWFTPGHRFALDLATHWGTLPENPID